MKHVFRFLTLAVLLAAGVFTSVALAEKPPAPPGQTSNPGSPGDDCSHGNSDQPCKPDPQPGHGSECDDHGNARGNEDHCQGTTDKTISTSTSTTTSTISSSISTSTSTSTSTTTSTTTNAAPLAGSTTFSTPRTTTSTVAGTSTTPAPAFLPPRQTNAPSGRADRSSVRGRSTSWAKLPFTGFPT